MEEEAEEDENVEATVLPDRNGLGCVSVALFRVCDMYCWYRQCKNGEVL